MQQKKLGAYVRNNHDYYDAMVSHGYIMPTLSSSIVTREYMDGIRKGEYYCPHRSQNIPKLAVANPPPKLELLKIWKKAVYDKVKTDRDPKNDAKYNAILSTIEMIETDGKLPDNDWLIVVLADIPGKDCEIFQKRYKYVKPAKVNQR